MAKEASAIDRLRQIEAERAQIMSDAKGEAMAAVEAAVAALSDLGFSYRVVDGAKASRKGTRQVNADRPCPICGFITDPPHDARAHRAQEKKKAFSANELAERGMKKSG